MRSLLLATVLAAGFGAGCSQVRVMDSPELDRSGLLPGQVVDSARINDWMRWRAVHVVLADGTRSATGAARIQQGELVWRPRDGNPFRKAPLRHEPLSDVLALERRHRFWPFVGGAVAGGLVAAAIAESAFDEPEGDESGAPTSALLITAGTAAVATGTMLLGTGSAATLGGVVGIRDGIYLHPRPEHLERLRREARRRTADNSE